MGVIKKKQSEKKKEIKSLSKKERPVYEESAGGLVFKQTKKGILFAMINDSYGKWTFPKGHVEVGEAIEETAARETLEELGLEEIRLLESLGKITIWFRDRFIKKGKLIRKDISYFLFETPESMLLIPHPEERVQKVAWVPKTKILKKSFYKDMIPIIEQALKILEEKK
jgi:8-oxo-dGTP pyrophosphatase MutT (NUDIX family)